MNGGRGEGQFGGDATDGPGLAGTEPPPPFRRKRKIKLEGGVEEGRGEGRNEERSGGSTTVGRGGEERLPHQGRRRGTKGRRGWTPRTHGTSSHTLLGVARG